MNKKFLSNTAWIIGGKIIQQVIGLVVGILTASYLGPGNFGVIGYIGSFCTLFTSLSNLGLNSIIVKEIIERKGDEGKVLGTASLMQLGASLFTYVLVVGIVIGLNINDKTMWFCAILQSFSLVLAISENINYYYQSRLESKITTIATLVGYICVQIYKVVLLVLGKSVVWFAAANTIEWAVIAIFVFSVYVGKKGPRFGFSKDIAKSMLKQCYPYIFAGMISALYASIDKIMLKEMLNGTEMVGYYNVAHTIGTFWIFVVSALITSFSPLIYEALYSEGENGKLYKTRLRQMYFVVFWLGAIASICVDILGPIVIHYFYQGIYDQSIVPAMILTWASTFAYLGVARGVQFVCENKQKYVLILCIFTVIVNVCMNALLIPKLQVIGASIATLVSECFMCIIAPMLMKKTRNVSFAIVEGIIGRGTNIKELYKSTIDKIKSKMKRTKVDVVDDNKVTEENEDEKFEEQIFNRIEDENNLEGDTKDDTPSE